MKKLRLLLSVCLVCSLLFGASLVANAEQQELENYNIYSEVYVKDVYGTHNVISGTIYPDNDAQEVLVYSINDFRTSADIQLVTRHTVDNRGVALFEGGKAVNIKLSNIYQGFSLSDTEFSGLLNNIILCLYYTDGTYEYLSGVEYDISKIYNYTVYNINCEFTPEKDVLNMGIEIYGTPITLADYSISGYVPLYVSVGEPSTYKKWLTMSLDVESKTEGLLSGILGKLQEVKDNISNVITSITELPQKIWSFIEDGLKSLFVPSEEFIISYKDKWDELLENRFGAIYQVATLMYDFWGQLEESYQQSTIEVPEVTIPLPDNNEFTFGGYEVDIIPNGFEFLAELVQLATSIVSTYLVMDGLRKRYENVVGG